MLEEDDFRDICVTLILDFCRDIIEDQTEIDDVTIAHVNRFCQDWIDENFGKDQTITEDVQPSIRTPPSVFGSHSCFVDTNLSHNEPDTNPGQE